MTALCRAIPLLAALLSVSSAVHAQAGLLADERTRYAVITGTGYDNRHGALLAIVLWRGEPGWEQLNGTQRSRVDSIFRWGQLRASEANQSFFGSGLAYGLLDRNYRELVVEGQHFPLAPGDSALVVMVTVPPNDLPRAVSTTRLHVAAVPDDFWPRSWSSGDTTFIVHPRYPRDALLLKQALLASPAVSVYLR